MWENEKIVCWMRSVGDLDKFFKFNLYCYNTLNIKNMLTFIYHSL